MVSFVSLHRGSNVRTARLVGVCADPELVEHVANALLNGPNYSLPQDGDPVLKALERGRRKALRMIARRPQAQPP